MVNDQLVIKQWSMPITGGGMLSKFGFKWSKQADWKRETSCAHH